MPRKHCSSRSPGSYGDDPGGPRPPAVWTALRSSVEELRDPALAVLAVAVAICGTYVLALAFFTPSLEWDSLAYHLPRAAFWAQQHAVAYVPNASDPRLNGNPPGAEIGLLATMLWSDGDRYVALPQLVAVAMLAVAIVGSARRIGLSRGQAIFGALLFAALPLVAIQASTTYNDLVVAGFLVVCVYGILGSTRLDLALVALGLGLALTTKLTAVIAIPLLVLVALAATPIRRLPALALAGGAGLLVGLPWYIVNLVETGQADGRLGAETAQDQPLSLLAIAPTIRRYVFSFIDFSGSRDIGVFTLYGAVAAAIVVVGVAIGLWRDRLRSAALVALGAASVVVVPLLLIELARGLLHAWFKLWLLVGRRDIAEGDASWQLQVGSDGALSWFGPAGAALLLLATVLVVVDVSRRRLPRIALLLALAPLVFAVVFAFLVPWDPWRGRFLVFAVALAATTWGVALHRRPVAWGVVALAAVALPLSLLAMYTKPSSAPFVHGHDGPSVWTDRWDVVLAEIHLSDAVPRTARVVNGREPSTVALAARQNDFLYPYFGRRLQNIVRLVPIDGGRVPGDAAWLVVAPGARVERCGRWTQVMHVDGWLLQRRSDADGSCRRVVARER